jgi:electron transport complex protein RnfB
MAGYSTVIHSVLVLGGIGLLCGIMLLVASKFFSTEVDPRVGELVKMLPGANCGACGFAGCARFAEDIIGGRSHPNTCKVLDDENAASISSFLGVEGSQHVRVVSILRCQGGNHVVQKRSEYHGIKSCRAASLYAGGNKACSYSCLGYGDCISVCPFDAIQYGEDGLVVIDRAKCTGCGKCIPECPKSVLSLVPRSAQVSVACFSKERGKKVSQVCKQGCIACKRCEEACPLDAIHVEDNLANIDYQKCDNCGQCVEACPTKSILRV